MLSTKSSRLGVIGDLYLINWTEPLVWNGFISAPQTFSRPTFVVKLDDVRSFVVKNFGWLRQFSSFSTENGDGHIQISQRWPIEISLYISLKSFSDLGTQKYVGVPVWRSHGRQRGRGFTTFQKLLWLPSSLIFCGTFWSHLNWSQWFAFF